MRNSWQQLGYLIFAILIFTGCSQADESSKILSLSLVEEKGEFRITGYQVLDRVYQHSPQQGNYQAHLLDEKQKIIQEVTFERFDFSSSSNTVSNQKFTLELPLTAELSKIVIYRLDGSSGHYRLMTNDPLLKWTLPSAIQEKYGSLCE